MLDLGTDYAILSAHGKMAAATPPCVQLLLAWSPCTEGFLWRHGQKMAHVTSPQNYLPRLPAGQLPQLRMYVCTNNSKFIVDVWAFVGFPHLLSWLLNTQPLPGIKVGTLKLPALLWCYNRHTVLERPLGDVEAACYSCCSVGPDPTVGGQHYHGHLTWRNQGTCTNEGELYGTRALRSNHYIPVINSHHPDKVSFCQQLGTIHLNAVKQQMSKFQ